VRTLLTLALTVLIILSTVLTMSLAFVVAGGLATLVVYRLTDNLETALAVGLLAGLVGWLGVPSCRTSLRGYNRAGTRKELR
jgi:hypothetical protein